VVVAYAWHPWAAQLVRVHEVLEREGGAWARCTLAAADVVRLREIPTWMLDASVCRTMRRSAEPVAAPSALVALRALLTIVLLVHWMGGAHTEHRLPRRRRGQRNSTPSDLVEAVRGLALVMKDHHIAGVLNRNRLKTGNGNRWTRERITALRSHYEIPVDKPADDDLQPWLTLNDAAALIGVAARTLRLAAERGEIEAAHPLADGPWLFRRADLDGPAGQGVASRVQNGRPPPTVPDPSQQNLFPSTT
jgi:hypothetical protein